MQRVFPTPRTYHLLPFVLAGAFVLVALLPKGSSALGVVAFGIAGLGCSALLPLTISFSQEQLVALSSMVAGAIIAFYQLGYGIAAFGAGPLQGAGVSLSTIFGVTGVFALAGRTVLRPRAPTTRCRTSTRARHPAPNSGPPDGDLVPGGAATVSADATKESS